MTNIAPKCVLSPIQQAWLQELGVDRRLLADALPTRLALEPTPASIPASDAAQGEPATEVQQSRLVTTSEQRAVPAQPLSSLPQDLGALRALVADCTQCGLHAGRHQAVFGEGQVETPTWMVIGEAPGDQDDETGKPFQGRAGRLLQTMFQTCGLSEQASFYYTNALKCRPRGGRAPRQSEIVTCLPFLQAQINQIRPSAILVLGWLAAQALLQKKTSLEMLRGDVHTYRAEHGDIPVIVTYHPAALLLKGQYKAQAWRDMHKARALLC